VSREKHAPVELFATRRLVSYRLGWRLPGADRTWRPHWQRTAVDLLRSFDLFASRHLLRISS